MRSSPRFAARLALAAVLPIAFFLAACSGSAPVAPPPADPAPIEEAPDGPPYAILHTNADGLRLTDLRTSGSGLLAQGAAYGGVHAASPSGRYVAVGLAWPDSAQLVLVDAHTGARSTLHRGPATTVYTPAWAPDVDALVFGHYVPSGDAMGRGGIATAALDGTVRDAGCSASKRALAWLPDGPLLVSDGANLYVVEAEGCRTLNALDARRLHEVTVSPDGLRMAYIYRELNYDRASRAYVPDSTLYIADVTGENAVEVAGDRYRAHRPAWSPDGRVLAFDVAPQEHPDARSISLYDLDTGQATYLVPPDETGGTQDTRALWSPDGRYLAFTRTDRATGSSSPMVYSFEELLLRTAASGDLERPAATGWAGAETLVLRGAATTLLAPMSTSDPIALPPHTRLIHATPSSPIVGAP